MNRSLTVVFAAAALNLVIGGYNYWKHRAHAGWLSATGHIESSNLRNEQKDAYLLEMLQGGVFVAEVAYSYPFEGTYYSGRSDMVFRNETKHGIMSTGTGRAKAFVCGTIPKPGTPSDRAGNCELP
jgi:hypothetical protein